MLKKISENKIIVLVIIIGLVITAGVSTTLLKANQTIKIWVPNRKITAGTIVTQDMIKQIDYPANAIGGFVESRNLIVGYRLKNTVDENQLLYPSDFIAAWESYSTDLDVPEDFVITSLQVPNERACGGLIVAGDTVDVLGVSKGRVSGFDEKSAINGRENIGTNVYYILSNVKIINTNSALSQSQGYELNDILDESSKRGQYYIIALSYDDAKKLRQAEGSLELWLNIAPRQNLENEPLIAQMVGQSWSGLHDAQKQVANPDGTPIEGVPQITNEEIPYLYPTDDVGNIDQSLIDEIFVQENQDSDFYSNDFINNEEISEDEEQDLDLDDSNYDNE